MTRLIRPVLLAMLFSLLWPIAAWSASSPFTDTEGNRHQVADFTGDGRWTVVMIWASDCVICRGEAPDLEAFHQRHKDVDARVLGLSTDGPSGLANAREFIKDTGLSFPNLVGGGEDIAALYYDETGSHLVGTPAFLIFNPEGRLRSYQTGHLNIKILEHLIRSQPPLAVARGR